MTWLCHLLFSSRHLSTSCMWQQLKGPASHKHSCCCCCVAVLPSLILLLCLIELEVSPHKIVLPCRGHNYTFQLCIIMCREQFVFCRLKFKVQQHLTLLYTLSLPLLLCFSHTLCVSVMWYARSELRRIDRIFVCLPHCSHSLCGWHWPCCWQGQREQKQQQQTAEKRSRQT